MEATTMTTTRNAADLAARILMATLFLVTGLGKVTGYAATQGYMAAMGVPGVLLPLVIALEIGGAIAIVLGFRTQLVALLLAGFCVVAALIFHRAPGDPMQSLMFMKNLAIAGGFLHMTVFGSGSWSLDARRRPQPATAGRHP
jgi:putative oxidoreductase